MLNILTNERNIYKQQAWGFQQFKKRSRLKVQNNHTQTRFQAVLFAPSVKNWSQLFCLYFYTIHNNKPLQVSHFLVVNLPTLELLTVISKCVWLWQVTKFYEMCVYSFCRHKTPQRDYVGESIKTGRLHNIRCQIHHRNTPKIIKNMQAYPPNLNRQV